MTPAAAASEYLGLFRADLQSFLDDATVDSAIVPNRRMLPRLAGVEHVAFTDVAGGVSGGDSFTLSIAHQEASGRVGVAVSAEMTGMKSAQSRIWRRIF